MTPDQYNNVTGKAHTGNNFCVITTYGEAISVPNVNVKGFWFTNSAYSVNSILNGDYYAGAPFEATDWFKCTVVVKSDKGTNKKELDLAKDGSYVKDWEYCDLSDMGKVSEISFEFTGSRSNDYGVLTPAYICIDDVQIEE